MKSRKMYCCYGFLWLHLRRSDKQSSWLNTCSVPRPAPASPPLWGGSEGSLKVSLRRTEVQSMKEAAGGAETQWNPGAGKLSLSPVSVNGNGSSVGLQLMREERRQLPDNHPLWVNHRKANSGECHARLLHPEFYANLCNCLARWGQQQLMMAVLDRNSQSRYLQLTSQWTLVLWWFFFPLIN